MQGEVPGLLREFGEHLESLTGGCCLQEAFDRLLSEGELANRP